MSLFTENDPALNEEILDYKKPEHLEVKPLTPSFFSLFYSVTLFCNFNRRLSKSSQKALQIVQEST